jgi:Resolvase, N terminal domain
MVLSDNGDHPMTKLSDTQLVIRSAAAQRDDLSVLPLPDSLTLKGGALNKVMDSLRNRGLIRVLGGDGGPERVAITFVSVTQSFFTTTSMGRLTLNILLPFAHFERELAGERIRDKFAASRRKDIFIDTRVSG